MCGICLQIRAKNDDAPMRPEYEALFKNRGPDYFGSKMTEDGCFSLRFWASILHMRGESVCAQPSETPGGNILVFNGEIYNGLEIPDHGSDTEVLLGQLDVCTSHEEVLRVMSKIEGPWSFVFYMKFESLVCFGRDVLGRRSLLWTSEALGTISLASLAINSAIDLLNVAFESNDSFLVPDRITGLEAFEKLRQLYPERTWNFVRIDVKKQELKFWREKRISKLLAPCQTVLDDSLGCALWFAARGQGTLHEGDTEIYTSPAKIVIQGTGADELLGGYARHRGRFQKEGWSGVIKELEMELGRISSRNLGRDNRIIADHARESRLPYLDEDFISFVNELPIWMKTNLHLERGMGEKILLRLALWKLGFEESSLVAKRAMQFGSRIAKLENSKEKANAVCDRLVKNK